MRTVLWAWAAWTFYGAADVCAEIGFALTRAGRLADERARA